MRLPMYGNPLECVWSKLREDRFDIQTSRIKVTETNFQTDKERAFPISRTLMVLTYHGAPFISNVRQPHRTGFQLDQVVQRNRNESAPSSDVIDG